MNGASGYAVGVSAATAESPVPEIFLGYRCFAVTLSLVSPSRFTVHPRGAQRKTRGRWIADPSYILYFMPVYPGAQDAPSLDIEANAQNLLKKGAASHISSAY